MRYDTVLFDLDGTILESGRGIINGMLHTLATCGVALPEGFDVRRFIGPPLKYSFESFLNMRGSVVEEASKIYRAYYSEKGLYEADFYPGMKELLASLHASGVKVCLATSKFHILAERMVDHYDMRPYLSFCSMSDGTSSGAEKKDIILKALKACPAQPGRAVMVGDTKYDAEGATDSHTPFIGVLYGYGTQAEMEEACPNAVFAKSVTELGALLQ